MPNTKAENRKFSLNLTAYTESVRFMTENGARLIFRNAAIIPADNEVWKGSGTGTDIIAANHKPL